MGNETTANGASNTELTQEQLLSKLYYNPETGTWTWLKSCGPCKAGTKAGSSHKHIQYIEISIDGRNYYAHRLANLYMTGEWPAHQMDHANGIRTDNRWSNLRPCTKGQNEMNKPGWSSTGYKYVRARDTVTLGTRYHVDVRYSNFSYRSPAFASVTEAVAHRDRYLERHGNEFTNTTHKNDQ